MGWKLVKILTVVLGLLVFLAYVWPSGFIIFENLLSGLSWDTNLSQPDALSFAFISVYFLRKVGLIILLPLVGLWLYRDSLDGRFRHRQK